MSYITRESAIRAASSLVGGGAGTLTYAQLHFVEAVVAEAYALARVDPCYRFDDAVYPATLRRADGGDDFAWLFLDAVDRVGAMYQQAADRSAWLRNSPRPTLPLPPAPAPAQPLHDATPRKNIPVQVCDKVFPSMASAARAMQVPYHQVREAAFDGGIVGGCSVKEVPAPPKPPKPVKEGGKPKKPKPPFTL